MNKKIKDILDNIDLAEMLEQVDKGTLNASMSKFQNQLQSIKATGEAGGGFVKIEVDGNRKACRASIDESLLTPENKSILEDLVVAAINIANTKIESAIEEKAIDGEWDHLMN